MGFFAPGVGELRTDMKPCNRTRPTCCPRRQGASEAEAEDAARNWPRMGELDHVSTATSLPTASCQVRCRSQKGLDTGADAGSAAAAPRSRHVHSRVGSRKSRSIPRAAKAAEPDPKAARRPLKMASNRDDLLIRLVGALPHISGLAPSPDCKFKNALTQCKTLTDIRGSRGRASPNYSPDWSCSIGGGSGFLLALRK